MLGYVDGQHHDVLETQAERRSYQQRCDSTVHLVGPDDDVDPYARDLTTPCRAPHGHALITAMLVAGQSASAQHLEGEAVSASGQGLDHEGAHVADVPRQGEIEVSRSASARAQAHLQRETTFENPARVVGQPGQQALEDQLAPQPLQVQTLLIGRTAQDGVEPSRVDGC